MKINDILVYTKNLHTYNDIKDFTNIGKVFIVKYCNSNYRCTGDCYFGKHGFTCPLTEEDCCILLPEHIFTEITDKL